MRMRILSKTMTYACLHVAVATMVAYALTGNLGVALGIGLIEPIVQTFVFAAHEWIWEEKHEFRFSLKSLLHHH